MRIDMRRKLKKRDVDIPSIHPSIRSSLLTYKLNYPSLPHFRRPRHHGYVFTQWRHRKECSVQGQCGMKLFTFCLPFLQHNPSIFLIFTTYLPRINSCLQIIFRLFKIQSTITAPFYFPKDNI